IHELQQLILKADGFLPNIVNEDEADLARDAVFTASSCQAGGEAGQVVNGISRKLGENWNGWVSDGISEGGETLTMTLPEKRMLSQLRLTFWSDFSYPIRVTMAPNRQRQQRAGVPAELVKDYTVRLMLDHKVVKEIEVKDNYQRLNVLDFEGVTCDSAEIVVHSTNGHRDAVIFEVRAY
ncbi:MAG: FAD-dependent oxidoreductase, partial [Clostridia bacterium]|nr:FAD-dependent oxidoreductase [Clostridia bacterium]